jgi:NRAMP (natural resistance-associated macrophage protein)-like metal ion transporter
MAAAANKHRKKRRLRQRVSARLQNPSIWQCLGPGLITGAADDDPSGIATYSQTGARFGLETLWTLWLTYPLMVAMQYVSALIGRVTGAGLASNIRKRYPAPVLYAIIAALFVANTINLGADIGAMGEAMRLLVGGRSIVWSVVIAIVAMILIVALSFHAYARLLKYLTLSLFAYAAVLLFAKIAWADVARSLVLPHLQWNNDYLTAIVAIFGTTISPYLFFWQASHEVEQQKHERDEQPLKRAPHQADVQLRRVRVDTLIGMGVSNVVAFCIMLTGAAVLHAHGINDIDSAAQAAKALEPVAGKWSFVLFALGIIGTGMLAIPTLAGSTAYAVAETFKWPKGLNKHFFQASGFYAIIGVGTVLGVLLNAFEFNPMTALYWSAVINGVVAVPLMVIIMLLSGTPAVMGRFTASTKLKWSGWLATVVMALAALAMIGSWFMHKPS